MTDTITALLDLMRVRSTAYISKYLTAPWGVHIDEHSHLSRFHIVISGSTWIGMPGQLPQKLNAGDIAIIPQGKAHDYFHPKTHPDRQVMAYPNPQTSPRFAPFDKTQTDTHLLCGYFEIAESTPDLILSRLPDILVGRRGDAAFAKKFDMIIDLVIEEISQPDTASQASLNRLTEILCLHTIRAWMETALPDTPHLQAMSDSNMMRVLDAVHKDPFEPWTVDTLAELHGKSRSAFSAHFKAATGESPLSYIRCWRLKLACKMLKDRDMTLDEIAFKSGYSDTNAFNRAFKRALGSPPGAYANRQAS